MLSSHFFQLIASYLDELVANVFEWVAKQKRHSASLCATSITVSEVLQKAMADINDGNNECEENQERYDRRKLALKVVSFVQECSIVSLDSSESLFKIYLRQYIVWKIGCASSSIFQRWWTIRLRDIDDITLNNVVAIHVIARIFQMDIIKIASAIELLDSMSKLWDINPVDEELNTRDLCDFLFQSIEHQLLRDPSHPISVRWPLLLSSAFNKTNTKIDGNEDKELIERLRRISFLSLNLCNGQSTNKGSYEENLAQYATMDSQLHSVPTVQNKTDKSEGIGSTDVANISQLELFLSPIWVRATDYFLATDVEQLLEEIDKGRVSGSKAVGLLKSASKSSSGLLFHGYSMHVLLQATRRLDPGCNTRFTEMGERCSLPHYIPEWLRANDKSDSPMHIHINTSEHNVYIAEYHNAISGNVANVLFEFFLSIFAAEAATKTSAQLFLILWKELDSESTVTRQMYTQLSRLRNTGTATSLQGSQTVMIANDARMLCFVAKVASEIAVDMKSTVLDEAYATEAIRFIDELMGTVDVAKWQEFFIATILRIRGEGTLSSALQGPLTCFSWCKMWAEGIPTCGNDLVDRLRQAEGALTDANADEQWKSRNQRSCPHCRQVFEVSAVNCGRFICGRDFHLNNGRTEVDGVVAESARGCGKEFPLDTSIPYQIDETKISQQQFEVDEIKERMQCFEQGSGLWTRAKYLSIPPLLVVEEKKLHHDLIYPSLELLAQEGANSNQSKCINCLRILWEYCALAPLALLLPDLIEVCVLAVLFLSFNYANFFNVEISKFYLWIHDTLCFLVTKDLAYTTSMFDLMKKEVLQERFDLARVHHLIELWDRVCEGFDVFLITNNRTVNFECEDVKIPFDKLQNAKLICLLSEGSHPTENDFLFLVIQNIISMYNRFSEKLSPYCMIDSNTVEKGTNLSPRFIIRGFGGAVRIGSASPLPEHSLNWVAECSWDSCTEKFDLGKVETLLNTLVNLQDPPSLILNPLDYLREKFCFRNDSSQPIGARDTDNSVSIDRCGNFHGNFYDFELFETVHGLLSLLDMVNGDATIRRTIMDLFQCLNYEHIRALLEGCRNIIEELFDSGKETCFTSLDALLLDTTSTKAQATKIAHMQEFGFPEMDTKQNRLILSLNNQQFVELVWYCGYQLASEAHLFSKLPLHVGEPLSDQMKHDLDLNLSLLGKDLSAKNLAADVDEFVRDVLGYYESQIVDESSKSAESLQSFLLSHNFSDSSDPIFAALPKSISLRNYISLRQSLQQVKLSYLSRAQESSIPPQVGKKNPSMTSTSMSQCWLWEDLNCFDASENECNAVRGTSPHAEKKFWFERDVGAKKYSGDSGIDVGILSEESIVFVTMDENSSFHDDSKKESATNEDVADICDEEYWTESKAVLALQRWWRVKYEQRKVSDVVTYDYFDDDVDYDDEAESDVECHSNKLSSNSDEVIRCNIDTKSTVESGVVVEMNLTETMHQAYGTYGTTDDEMRMRRWLDQQRLPQSMADAFVAFGVRSIDDICFLLSEDEDDDIKELMSQFLPLDHRKLRKAVKSVSSTPSSLLSDIEMFDSTLNWLEEME